MIRSASSVMGTSALTIKNLAGYDHLISKATTIQCVRWKRKPIWLPTAKSKLFRVPERPVISDEENEELQRLNNSYRTMTKSLRSFFVNKHIEMRNKSRVITSQEHIDEDFIFRFNVNKKWNEQVAAAREERLKNLRENRTEEILKKMEMKAERDLQIQLRVDATIRKAKEESATFITKDNIDQAIEKAFENIIDYNSAIDLDGNTYVIDNKETAENTEKLENTV
nr:probable 28S ribosomal protein S26, mitochondrial [Megalopta genalis]